MGAGGRRKKATAPIQLVRFVCEACGESFQAVVNPSNGNKPRRFCDFHALKHQRDPKSTAWGKRVLFGKKSKAENEEAQ